MAEDLASALWGPGGALEHGRCIHTEDGSDSVDSIYAGAVDAALKGADVSPIDACAVGERLLRQPLLLPEPPKVARKHLSYVHTREGIALRRISPRSILDKASDARMHARVDKQSL